MFKMSFFKYQVAIFFVMVFLCGNSLFGQKDTSYPQKRKNSVFLEVGGNAAQFGGLHYTLSLNYDRIFFVRKSVRGSIRLGATIPYLAQTRQVFPLLLNVLFGRKKFFLELGIGGALIYEGYNFRTAYGAYTSVIGLRYQNPELGIMMRLGITPTIANKRLDPFFYVGAWLGASVGYSF